MPKLIFYLNYSLISVINMSNIKNNIHKNKSHLSYRNNVNNTKNNYVFNQRVTTSKAWFSLVP